MLVAVMAQRRDAHAKLIGQGAQILAGAQVLVNRGAPAVTADGAHALHQRGGSRRHARCASHVQRSALPG
jgi:hypothetical protein